MEMPLLRQEKAQGHQPARNSHDDATCLLRPKLWLSILRACVCVCRYINKG